MTTRSHVATAERVWRIARFRVRALVVAEWVIAVASILMAIYVDIWCTCIAFASLALWTARIAIAEPAARRAEQDLRICKAVLKWERDREKQEAARNRYREPGESGIHARGSLANRAWN